MATDQEVLGSTPSRRTNKEEYENIFRKISYIFSHNSFYNTGINNNFYLMNKKFIQISTKPGFMKFNGGILLRKVKKNEYEFKVKVKKNHLNQAGITHGGYLASVIDSGSGTAARLASKVAPCVTISLDIKFIEASKLGDELIGNTKIQKITHTMVFLICTLKCKGKIIASASGIWKKIGKSFKTLKDKI